MSHALGVQADSTGEWGGGAVSFATKEEAIACILSLAPRKTSIFDIPVVESGDPAASPEAIADLIALAKNEPYRIVIGTNPAGSLPHSRSISGTMGWTCARPANSGWAPRCSPPARSASARALASRATLSAASVFTSGATPTLAGRGACASSGKFSYRISCFIHCQRAG